MSVARPPTSRERSCARSARKLAPRSSTGRGVFRAMWVEPLHPNDTATDAKALTAAGLEPAEVMGWTNNASARAALRAGTDEAVARGVYGAPTTFVGEGFFLARTGWSSCARRLREPRHRIGVARLSWQWHHATSQ